MAHLLWIIGELVVGFLLGAVGSPQMVSPEAYVQFTPDLIDDQGKVSDESTRAFLVKFLAAFQKYLDRQLA